MGKFKPGERHRPVPTVVDEDLRPRVPALSEAQLEKYGTDLLALDGWRSLKTDPVSRREWGKGFGEKGMADRLYLRYGGPYPRDGDCMNELELSVLAEVFWIEWKQPGGKAEPHQRLWIDTERSRGALVLLAGEDFPATPEGFAAWYRTSGLLRKPGLC